MDRKYIVTILVAFCGLSQMYGYSDTYYVRKTIIQTVQACGPVTVDAAMIDDWGNIGSYSKYTISSGTTWNQRVRIKGGHDCNGTNLKIMLKKQEEKKHYPNGIRFKKDGWVYHYVYYETYYYTITTGSGSYGASGSSSNNGSLNKEGNTYSKAADSRSGDLGKAIGAAASATRAAESRYYNAGGFSLAATVSPTWGENLELRFRYGSSNFGGDVTGMIGYDWINKYPGDKLCWNAGIGAYFGGRPSSLYLWDVDLGVKIGKSNKPYNNATTVMIDLSTTHLLGPQHVIGLIAGGGIGLGGNGKSPDFVWDVRGGIVVYFLQWNWF